MDREKLELRTGKAWGSKFYPSWTLQSLIDWIKQVVQEEKWTLQPGRPMQIDRTFDHEIGLVRGKPTHKIRIVCDGRYVHAYPIDE